jgi:hypothetical protein
MNDFREVSYGWTGVDCKMLFAVIDHLSTIASYVLVFMDLRRIWPFLELSICNVLLVTFCYGYNSPLNLMTAEILFFSVFLHANKTHSEFYCSRSHKKPQKL